MRSELAERLRIEHPIFLAPMAGGPGSPELVAAVSESGGLGIFGAAYLSAEQISQACERIRSLTSKPFGINVFAPLAVPGDHDESAALSAVRPYFAELGLEPPSSPSLSGPSWEDAYRAVLESGAALLSFTFGILSAEALAAARFRGMLLAGTATTVREAILLQEAGVDAVVAQGFEAGAHRGTFDRDFESSMVGTLALVPQMVDAVRIPVVASGGIMDGRGIVAARALGSDAVQMGTAFLTCEEAGTSEAYKQAVLSAREDQTRVTRAFSGRHARGIVNRFMDEVGESVPLPYPLQNALTRPLRTEAAKRGRAEFLSLWAGQGVRMARRTTAGALIASLVEEAEQVRERIAG